MLFKHGLRRSQIITMRWKRQISFRGQRLLKENRENLKNELRNL